MIEMISGACHNVIVSTLWCFYWRDFNQNSNNYSFINR